MSLREDLLPKFISIDNFWRSVFRDFRRNSEGECGSAGLESVIQRYCSKVVAGIRDRKQKPDGRQNYRTDYFVDSAARYGRSSAAGECRAPCFALSPSPCAYAPRGVESCPEGLLRFTAQAE